MNNDWLYLCEVIAECGDGSLYIHRLCKAGMIETAWFLTYNK